MGDFNFAQIAVTVLLSSGFVGGIFGLLSKTLWSPESKNELAKLGNEFAHQLLTDAKSEREELRLTIRELENLVTEKHETIERLKNMLRDKDRVIVELEHRQASMAEKLSQGLTITLQDIFGDKAPKNIHLSTEDVV